MAYLHKVGDTVNIYESMKRSGDDNVTRLLATLECDEWFSLECRYYRGDKDSVRLKWYINGELAAVTDNFYVKETMNADNAVPTSPASGAKLLIYAMKSPAFGIYIDNVLVGIYSEEYTVEEGDLIYNIDSK
jgi:hypothetical protein